MAEKETPQYMRFRLDTWRTLSAKLPPAQRAKVVDAMLAYFFDGEEPREGRLPKDAQFAFDLQRGALESYRRNVENGTKNRPERR